jgi:hypothetical protein
MVVFGQNRWWDRLNVKFPNFQRWEQYLRGSIVADNNKPMLLWQVPVGNQYFRSENNTDGHYQDNRPEYIFGHIQELIDTGIIAALFGPGNAGNTNYGDSKNDGVTNPPPFFRQDITVSTDATLLVDFELWDSQSQKVWQIWHDNQPIQPGAILTDAAVMTVPDDLPPGQYTFVSGVFSAGWGTMYAWNGNAGSLIVIEPPLPLGEAARSAGEGAFMARTAPSP